MALELVEITDPQDPRLAKVVDIFIDGFRGTAPSQAMFPKGKTPAIRAQFLSREREGLSKVNGPLHFLAVVDTEADEIVSAAGWRLETVESLEKRHEEDNATVHEYPEEVNTAALAAFTAKGRQGHLELMGIKPHVHLRTLATAPTHRRRGAAALLLAWGIKQADTLNQQAYLQSTLMAKPLYERMGFEERGSFTTDFTEHGLAQTDTHYFMLREPRPTAAPTAS